MNAREAAELQKQYADNKEAKYAETANKYRAKLDVEIMNKAEKGKSYIDFDKPTYDVWKYMRKSLKDDGYNVSEGWNSVRVCWG